jgi:hypothetical protein
VDHEPEPLEPFSRRVATREDSHVRGQENVSKLCVSDLSREVYDLLRVERRDLALERGETGTAADECELLDGA